MIIQTPDLPAHGISIEPSAPDDQESIVVDLGIGESYYRAGSSELTDIGGGVWN